MMFLTLLSIVVYFIEAVLIVGGLVLVLSLVDGGVKYISVIRAKRRYKGSDWKDAIAPTAEEKQQWRDTEQKILAEQKQRAKDDLIFRTTEDL